MTEETDRIMQGKAAREPIVKTAEIKRFPTLEALVDVRNLLVEIAAVGYLSRSRLLEEADRLDKIILETPS